MQPWKRLLLFQSARGLPTPILPPLPERLLGRRGSPSRPGGDVGRGGGGGGDPQNFPELRAAGRRLAAASDPGVPQMAGDTPGAAATPSPPPQQKGPAQLPSRPGCWHPSPEEAARDAGAKEATEPRVRVEAERKGHSDAPERVPEAAEPVPSAPPPVPGPSGALAPGPGRPRAAPPPPGAARGRRPGSPLPGQCGGRCGRPGPHKARRRAAHPPWAAAPGSRSVLVTAFQTWQPSRQSRSAAGLPISTPGAPAGPASPTDHRDGAARQGRRAAAPASMSPPARAGPAVQLAAPPPGPAAPPLPPPRAPWGPRSAGAAPRPPRTLGARPAPPAPAAGSRGPGAAWRPRAAGRLCARGRAPLTPLCPRGPIQPASSHSPLLWKNTLLHLKCEASTPFTDGLGVPCLGFLTAMPSCSHSCPNPPMLD